MAAISVQVPYPVFYDRDGQPLDNGNIYIGVANLDPVTNPLQVYYDEALTIAAAQPLKTSNGYIYRNGTPAQLYVNATNFSITAKNANNTLVYNFPDGTGLGAGASGIAFTGFNGQTGTIADLGDADGSDWIGYTPTGAGATARTAQNKMRDTVSVKDYGAVGDGVANDTAAIQAAINAAGASGGGMVYFPSGDYKLLSAVNIGYERITLFANNDASIIISSLTNNGIVVGSAAAITNLIVIDGLRFDRPVKSTNGAAIKMVQTGYSTIKNCVFKNSRFGVEVKTHNDSLTIQNNLFLEGTYFGVLENNINETWANDLTIRGNFFWHVEEAAVYMSADGVGVASVGDTYIEDNVIVGSPAFGALQTQYAIKIEGAGTYNTNISIQRNTFEGIALQTVYLTNLNRCRIEGNYFSGTGANDVGLYWDGGVGNSVISGNIFIGYNNQAAKFISTGGLTIANNNFTANVTLGGNIAELEFTTCSDIQVTGNYFYASSAQYAIEFLQVGGTPNNVVVTGNNFAKFSGNTNYVFDISWQALIPRRVFANNLGNDFTSGAGTAIPSAGNALQWYVGDVIRNTNPSVLGAAASQYVISGWVCTTAGDPGTWSQQRTLTGT